MSYTNTPVTTSVSGSWNGTSISYSSIALIDGIPHNAQLEVERVFTTTRDSLPITDFLNNPLFTAKDKREVFVIPNSRITFNETSKTITAIDLPNIGNVYNYDPVDAGVSDVQVPQIAVSQTLKIRRKSVSNSPLVTWSAGNKLTSNQLNLETTQLLYLTQELIDKVTTETTVSNIAIGDIPDNAVTPAKLSAGGPNWNSIGDFFVDTDTLYVDESTDRVGINISTPTTALDVVGTVTATAFSGPLTGNVTGTIQTAAQPNITSLGTLSSATISGNLTVDTNTLFVDSSNNRVGIGTLSPARQLHIHENGAGSTTIQITNTDTGSTDSDGMQLGLDGTEHAFIWNYENKDLYFGANNLERLRILASGNVEVKNVIRACSTVSLPASGSTTCGVHVSSTANLGVFFGTGAPTFAAAKGSLYLNTTATTTTTRIYINTNGSTTWTTLTTAA